MNGLIVSRKWIKRASLLIPLLLVVFLLFKNSEPIRTQAFQAYPTPWPDSLLLWDHTDLDQIWIDAIAVAPTDPNTLFATSGVIKPPYYNGQSVYRSKDAGKHWVEVDSSWPHLSVAIHPTNPKIVYVGQAYEVLKSTDGGDTWMTLESVGASEITAIVIDPLHPSTVYVGVEYGGVGKTTNGAADWVNLPPIGYIDALAINPVNTNIIFAGTRDENSTDGGVYRSLMGGEQWVRVLVDNQVNALAVDPKRPDIIYAGTQDHGVQKSTDGGDSWSPANNGLTSLIVKALVVSPVNPDVIYAGTWEGGVFRSTDAGENWTAINTGLTGMYVLSLAADPVDMDVLYAGTQEKGVYKMSGVRKLFLPMTGR